jgi:hypothetical protein
VFKFTYFDDRVESMLSDKGILWDNELKEELSPVLAQLKLCGEVEGASCGVKPGVMGLVYELRGKTFRLTYAIGSDKKEVRFYEFQPVSHAIDWKAALEQDCHIGEDEGYYIPQIGDQKKYLRAIDLIANGINTQGFRTRIDKRKIDNLGKRRRQDGAEIIMVEQGFVALALE